MGQDAAAGPTTDEARPQTTKDALNRRGARLRGRSVRQHAARGTIINSAYQIFIAGLALVRGLLLARFITRADYGIWGALVVSLGTLIWLKDVGIGDKYLQQDDEDQEHAFQVAFTMEFLVNAILLVLLLIAVPIMALAYGRSDLLAPGFSIGLMLPAFVLSVPLWTYSRKLDWGRQRLLQSINPIVSTVVALVMAIAGAGYWSLVGGTLAGAWSTAIIAVIVSPHPLRLRWSQAHFREYLGFSWPLFINGGASLVVAQTSIFVANAAIGIGAAGAITVASNVSQFSNQVDNVVSGTMYPVVCAVKDRVDLLYESFVKSNRVALMWAVPFGVGLALFAPEFVHYGIGDRWRPAIPVLRVFGLIAAATQLGFNWDDYFRARADTRPIAITSVITALSFVATAIPLAYADGLVGLAIAVGIQGAVNVACRIFFLRRLFGAFRVVRHTLRAAAPVLPAVAAVFALWAVESSPHRSIAAGIDIVAFAVVSVAATWALEHRLIREMIGYLTKRGSAAVPEPLVQ